MCYSRRKLNFHISPAPLVTNRKSTSRGWLASNKMTGMTETCHPCCHPQKKGHKLLLNWPKTKWCKYLWIKGVTLAGVFFICIESSKGCWVSCWILFIYMRMSLVQFWVFNLKGHLPEHITWIEQCSPTSIFWLNYTGCMLFFHW